MESLLVIDDEPDLLAGLQLAFSSSGYKVYTATNAEAGFRFMESYRPVAVLLDYKLTCADGMEFLDWTKGRKPGTPIILMTGDGPLLDSIEETSRKMGIYACLRKPFRVEEALDLIREALEKRSSPPPEGV